MYVGETFISCVFVCGKQGNARRGKNIKCLVRPWALVGPYGPPGPLWAGPLWAGP